MAPRLKAACLLSGASRRAASNSSAACSARPVRASSTPRFARAEALRGSRRRASRNSRSASSARPERSSTTASIARACESRGDAATDRRASASASSSLPACTSAATSPSAAELSTAGAAGRWRCAGRADFCAPAACTAFAHRHATTAALAAHAPSRAERFTTRRVIRLNTRAASARGHCALEFLLVARRNADRLARDGLGGELAVHQPLGDEADADAVACGRRLVTPPEAFELAVARIADAVAVVVAATVFYDAVELVFYSYHSYGAGRREVQVGEVGLRRVGENNLFDPLALGEDDLQLALRELLVDDAHVLALGALRVRPLLARLALRVDEDGFERGRHVHADAHAQNLGVVLAGRGRLRAHVRGGRECEAEREQSARQRRRCFNQ